MSLNCFLTLWTEWQYHELCCSFPYLEKWCWQAPKNSLRAMKHLKTSILFYSKGFFKKTTSDCIIQHFTIQRFEYVLNLRRKGEGWVSPDLLRLGSPWGSSESQGKDRECEAEAEECHVHGGLGPLSLELALEKFIRCDALVDRFQ